MRRIAVATGTRAEYGLLKPILEEIKKSSDLELSLIVTGMHFSEDFGRTVDEIKKDGYAIAYSVDVLEKDDAPAGMARYVGRTTVEMANALEKIKPDMLLILGDRAETLASAIAAAYSNIPVAHLCGGDVSGSIDNTARNAITKLAHIHFPATEKSAERIIKMGEEKWRVHVVGMPGLDSIFREKLLSKEEITAKLGIDLNQPFAIVVQHPVTTESEHSGEQMKETMDAIVKLNLQAVVIYPNADAGGGRMIQAIENYRKYPVIKIFKSLPHIEYLSLMNAADVMIGNSSSGIIEAPCFHLPVVNIGTRQDGRERSSNVIDADYKKDEIIAAVKKALYDESFKKQVKKCRNIYGDGRTAERVVKILSELGINQRLLQKRG